METVVLQKRWVGLVSSEKKWVALFAVVLTLWVLVLTSTIYPWMEGIEILVNTEVDLTYVTAPILGFNLVYVVMMIFIYIAYLATAGKVRNHQREMKKSSSMQNELCSIIIPARNEESVIKRTIQTCLQQTHKNVEVIVVCHNCSDATYERAKLEDPRVKVYELNTAESGKGIALNYGVEKSQGNYLLVLDSDGLLTNNFIELALPLFQSGYAAVQGRYISSNRNFNFITRMLSLEGDLWSTPFMSIRSFFGRRTPLGGTGYIIRKDILAKVGMFANHLVDDYELTFRLLRNDYRIAFAPLSVNYDEKPPTMESMFRQRARWGKGFIDLLSTRITQKSDLIGTIYWLNPIAAIAGLIMLLIPAYAAVHYFIFDYYPYTYTYIPLNVWLALTAVLFTLQATVVIKQYGARGIGYSAQIILLIPFSHYWFVTFIKAFTVKSWANTKTTHGFSEDTPLERIVADAS
jgi:cellulose synthase/poly-beta-1,6-N-acetylglucosamine synthase-like glycosyltransferase